MFGRYPIDERWRVDPVGILFVALLVPLLIPKVPYKRLNAILFFVVFPIVAFFLLVGGYFGLPYVETPLWGGLLVTLVVLRRHRRVAAARHPAGARPALEDAGRQDALRHLHRGVRGVPLITVLFMASVMLPLFLPPGVTFDKLLRALIGVALFSSAYMAEVVRGGLQAIPKGQYEGADSLGLGYWQKMGLIVLPQALKLVIPGIVNTFIGLFKDTTPGLDHRHVRPARHREAELFATPNWASPQTADDRL